MPEKITKYQCKICTAEYESEQDAENCEERGITQKEIPKGTTFLLNRANEYGEGYVILKDRIGSIGHNSTYQGICVAQDFDAAEAPVSYWTIWASWDSTLDSSGTRLLEKSPSRKLEKSEIEKICIENSVFRKALESVLSEP
ncbi:MAG: hypothetical protein WCP89_00395 [archaeon]